MDEGFCPQAWCERIPYSFYCFLCFTDFPVLYRKPRQAALAFEFRRCPELGWWDVTLGATSFPYLTISHNCLYSHAIKQIKCPAQFFLQPKQHANLFVSLQRLRETLLKSVWTSINKRALF